MSFACSLFSSLHIGALEAQDVDLISFLSLHLLWDSELFQSHSFHTSPTCGLPNFCLHPTPLSLTSDLKIQLPNDMSMWISNRHLNINMSKTELLIFSSPPRPNLLLVHPSPIYQVLWKNKTTTITLETRVGIILVSSHFLTPTSN